jgi:hypothetical protein
MLLILLMLLLGCIGCQTLSKAQLDQMAAEEEYNSRYVWGGGGQ